MFKNIFTDASFAVVLANCRQEEKDIIASCLKLRGASLIYYDPGFAFRFPERGEVLIVDSFSREILEELNRYSISVSIAGRLSPDEKHILYSSGYISFWNFDNDSIDFLISGMFRQVRTKYTINSIIWTSDKLFNRKLKSIFSFFSLQEVIAENTELALYALQEKHFDLMILDWDATGMETIRLIREFKEIRLKKNFFPRLLGIKDFEKPFVFQDLNMGIKDFSPVLFTRKEVLEILSASLPVIQSETDVIENDDVPLLKWLNGKDYQKLILEFPEERARKMNHKVISKNEFELTVFKKQFEWLKSFHA